MAGAAQLAGGICLLLMAAYQLVVLYCAYKVVLYRSALHIQKVRSCTARRLKPHPECGQIWLEDHRVDRDGTGWGICVDGAKCSSGVILLGEGRLGPPQSRDRATRGLHDCRCLLPNFNCATLGPPLSHRCTRAHLCSS